MFLSKMNPLRVHLVWFGLGTIIGGLVVRYVMSDISEGLAIIAAAGLTAVITAYQLHVTADDRRKEREDDRAHERRANAALVLGDIEAARATIWMELSVKEKRTAFNRERLERQKEMISLWERAGGRGDMPVLTTQSLYPSITFRAMEAAPLAVKSLPPEIIRTVLILRNVMERWNTEAEVLVEVAVASAEGVEKVLLQMAEALEGVSETLRPIANVQKSTLADQLTRAP